MSVRPSVSPPRAVSLLILLGVAASAACSTSDPSNADEDAQRVGEASHAVINGATDVAGAYTAVGRVGGCSGTLIAPSVVLTAGHCFASILAGCAPPVSPLNPIQTTFIDGNGNIRSPLGIKLIGLPGSINNVKDNCGCGPGNANAAKSDNRGKDLALLVLATPPVGITPMRVLVANNPNQIPWLTTAPDVPAFAATQPLVSFVGYGAGSAGRDFGVARWINTTAFLQNTGAGTAACPGAQLTTAQPAIVVRPDDLTWAQLANVGGGFGFDDYSTEPPGLNVPGAFQAVSGNGDSGGPLVLGNGPTLKGLSTPAALPAVNGLVVAGIAGDRLNPIPPSSPTVSFAPTYTNEATDFLVKMLADSDFDGVPDIADPCVLIGGSNADADVDGIADNCGNKKDPCPCSFVDDADGDGVCDLPPGFLFPPQTALCQGLVYDNCATVKNTDQNNCNKAAEQGNLAVELGDKCEPVPCPRTTPQYRRIDQTQTPVIGGGPVTITAFFSRYELDRVVSEPLGSRAYPALGSIVANNTPVLDTLVAVPTTDYRWCASKAASSFGYACDDSQFVRDAKLGPQAPFRATEPPPNGQAIWRRVWVEGMSVPPGGTSPADDSDRRPGGQEWDYRNDRNYARTWRFADDWAYWVAQTWNAQALLQPIGPGSDSSGVLGSHAATDRGMVSPDPSTCASLQLVKHHPSVANPCAAGQELANSITSMAARTGPFVNWGVEKAFTLSPKPPLWISKKFPIDGGPTGSGALDSDGIVYRGEAAAPVFRFPGRPELAGVLDPDGRVRDVGVVLGAALRASLASGMRLLSPAEPSPSLGRSEFEPIAVGVSDTGDALTEEVHMRNGRVLGRGDRIIVCDGESCGPAVGARLAAAPLGTEFVGVYARSRGLVFAVGKDRGVRQISTDGNVGWETLDLGVHQVADVVAATFEPTRGELWVLDELGPHRFGRKIRLSRIDVATGKVREIGQFAKLGLFDQHWLVSDHDGRMLVVASSQLAKRHVVVRLEIETDVKVVGVKFAKGELAWSPVVDVDGYTFPVRQGNDMPKLVRERQLEANVGTWLDLHGCF